MNMRPGDKYRALLITILFLVFISVPFLDRYLHFFKDRASSEKRNLAPEAILDVNKLDYFPSAYDKYFKDRFSQRNRLIFWYYQLSLRCFHATPVTGQVLLGQEGWLYSAGTEEDVFKGQALFSEAQLDELADEFERRAAYLEQQNCKFYVMFPPVKAYVYPQYLPPALQMQEGKSCGIQLEEYLQQRGRVKVIPVHEMLRNRTGPPSYFKLDNHWNLLGALLAANEAVRVIQKELPGLKSLPLDSFDIHREIIKTGNLIHILSYAIPLVDTNFVLVPHHGGPRSKEVQEKKYTAPDDFAEEYEMRMVSADTTAPRLMMVSDSFGNLIFHFLSGYFHESLKLFDAWKYQLHPDIVEQEKPDVYILLILESNIRNLLRENRK